MPELNPYEAPREAQPGDHSRARLADPKARQPLRWRLAGFRWRTIPASVLGFMGAMLYLGAGNLALTLVTKPGEFDLQLLFAGLGLGTVAIATAVTAAAFTLWHGQWLRLAVSLVMAAALFGAVNLAWVLWVQPRLSLG